MINKNKLLIVFVFSILLYSCKKETYKDLPADGSLKFLTYNVAGLPEGINGDQFPTKHMHLISPLLNNYDVVNVQEDFAYHDILYKQINLKYKTKYKADVVFGDGLNTVSKLPILNFKRIKWNNCNGTDCLTPKGFSYSKLRFNETTTIDLYNVHCNAGSSTNDLIARRNNIIQLLKYIDENSKGETVILMGDFNCRYTRSGDNIKLLVDSLGFTDVWIEKIRGNIYPLPNDSALLDCSPFATSSSCEVVDKVFYRNGSKIHVTPMSFSIDEKEFFDAEGEPLSDHRPMYVNFQYSIK